MKLTIEKANEMMKFNCGSLYLSNSKITELPEGLTVGGSLYLRNSKITELPEGLTVGGYLDLSDSKITGNKKYKHLKQGDYVPKRYIYADNILTHIKGVRKIKGYVFYKGKMKGRNVLTDGNYYSHCDTFKQGLIDLEFKKAKNRGAEQYKNFTLESSLPTEKIITMYRIITGACQQGTENFVKSLGKLKDSYTIAEAIKLTKGQYNATVFENFFKGE